MIQNRGMANVTTLTASDTLVRVQRLQVVTIVWMSAEVIVALAAAWPARSPALLGFGGDSAVELLSAVIVLWRFRTRSDTANAERLAARIAGLLLFLVGAIVVIASAFSLLGYRAAEPSLVGIVLLIVASIGMPFLAREKRKLAIKLSSASLKADAAESALCGYLSLIALVGLSANAFFHMPWADPVAALALVPFVVREGWEAIHSSRLVYSC